MSEQHVNMSPREITAKLMRLGAAYERADQARDYACKVEIERQINKLAELDENVHAAFSVLRGRNIIRNARKQELLRA